jgi:hypothetical protein
MADNTNSVSTPSQNAKRHKEKSHKNVVNNSSSNKNIGITNFSDSEEVRRETATSAEMLKAMNADTDEIGSDVTKANNIELSAKSPSRIISENNIFLASLNKGAPPLSLATLSMATYTTPVKTYQFLENIIPNRIERDQKLDEIYYELNVENASMYMEYRLKSKYPVQLIMLLYLHLVRHYANGLIM